MNDKLLKHCGLFFKNSNKSDTEKKINKIMEDMTLPDNFSFNSGCITDATENFSNLRSDFVMPSSAKNDILSNSSSKNDDGFIIEKII